MIIIAKTGAQPISPNASPHGDMTAVERAVWKKMRLRVLLPLTTLIFFSSLDRVNISFAALQMNRTLGITPESFGFAVGIFFVGYLLCQFPSTAIQRRMGTRRWLLGTVLSWGLCATAMAFVQNAGTLYALRFLLGAAESGLSPGIVYFCSTWMPMRFRAGAIAVTLLAIPISVIIGGPLSGFLLTSHNPWAISGWRWMFLIEGSATMVAAFVAYKLVSDGPDRAKWLTAQESAWVQHELQCERVAGSPNTGKVSIRIVLSNPRIWAMAGVWFALLLGSNGIIFWLPQALKQLSGASDFDVSVASTVPWVGVGIGMLVNSWHSDRIRERYWHAGLAALLAAAGLVLASHSGSSLLALVFLFLGGLGIGAAQGVFWAIPASMLDRSSVGSGITLVNLVGNLASLIGPYIIGALRQHSGNFTAPIYFIAVGLMCSTVLLAALHRAAQLKENH